MLDFATNVDFNPTSEHTFRDICNLSLIAMLKLPKHVKEEENVRVNYQGPGPSILLCCKRKTNRAHFAK